MSGFMIDKLENDDLGKSDLKKEAKDVCNGVPVTIGDGSNMTKGLFSDGSVLYLNTTEELMMKHFVKPGDRCATVLAGGDFLIDSIFHGSSEVLAFDINKYQYYLASLKIKLLQRLSYDEYCSFFSDETNNSLLSKEVYEKIKKDISSDDDCFSFMDVVIDSYDNVKKYIRSNIKKDPLYYVLQDLVGEKYDDPEINEIISKTGNSFENMTDIELNNLFSELGYSYKAPELLRVIHGLQTLKYCGSYLENEESFNNTKRIINDVKIKYINTDLNSLKYKLKKLNYYDSSFKGFDSIYLSNIPEYMSGSFFKQTIDNDLIDLLADDGVIVYSCLGLGEEQLRSGTRLLQFPFGNSLSVIRTVNDIDGYSLLKDKYDVSTMESKYVSLNNGVEDKDTFVFVKKK